MWINGMRRVAILAGVIGLAVGSSIAYFQLEKPLSDRRSPRVPRRCAGAAAWHLFAGTSAAVL